MRDWPDPRFPENELSKWERLLAAGLFVVGVFGLLSFLLGWLR